MATFTKFEEIDAWKTGSLIIGCVYKALRDGAGARDYAFKDQIQRAAVSITNNIAEGFESRSDRTFYDMLRRSKGSAGEVRNLLHVALMIGYLAEEKHAELCELCLRCSSQISLLMNHLEKTRTMIPPRSHWGDKPSN